MLPPPKAKAMNTTRNGSPKARAQERKLLKDLGAENMEEAKAAFAAIKARRS